MRQISQILNSYPRGISMTELRAELNKGYAGLDRDLYGYKKFSRFLLAMPHILKLLPGSDGQFFVRAITPKAPELFESSLGTSNGHVGRNGYQDLSKPLKLNGEESHKDEAVDGKSILPSSPEVNAEDPSRKIQQAPELSEKVVRMEMKEPLKKKPQPTPTEEKVSMPAGVQETEGNLSPVEEQDSSSEVGFFRKNWCRWFGGKDGVSEIKSQNIPEKCSDSGDISERTSHNYPEKSCISSDNFEKIKVNEKSMRSPSQDAYPVGSSEENKFARSTEPSVDNYTPRPGVLKRIINWCKFQSSDQDTDTLVDPSSIRQIEIHSNSQRHEVFMKDSFWFDMESFMDSPRGLVIVAQSRTREQLAQCLRKEGPLALRDLSDSDILNLVDMLISEKKWVEESPSEISPFKLIRPVVKRSSLGHSCPANGLRSIFSSTQSQSNPPNVSELNGEKKIQNFCHAGISPPINNKKTLDRSRNDILADCQNLVNDILKEYPEGYNMGSFRKLFLERYGYHLDLKKLGYQKLASLIQIMPGVKIESSHILPSRQVVGRSDQEFFFDNIQKDNAYHPVTSPDSESSETSKKNDDSDSPWEELGPISNLSFDRKDGQSMPRNSAMEETER
ncbi:uncharacterized protein LOC116122572 [Pistacia vera]|uniref:uncharacterized protein LOC116122572 n=1 Tax=Pistacia vera TaxID=55513 RepID=UPI0012630797|nr:uncharacterized protein LOC116122572 [Pistacia vera]